MTEPTPAPNLPSFSELEVDALQELMNISFGGAAAELAETIDIFVELKTPNMSLVEVRILPGRINKMLGDFGECSFVEQFYRGDINGAAFLIFPTGVEREFISLFQDQDVDALKTDILLELEKEILFEVGNILVGACVGKLFDMLDCDSTFMPPRAIIGEEFQKSFIQGAFKDEDFAVIIHTQFSFEDRNVAGHLFLLNNQDSMKNLKDAITRYLGRYS